MKSVQIRSFFWSVFSHIRTRKNSIFGHSLGNDKEDFVLHISINCFRMQISFKTKAFAFQIKTNKGILRQRRCIKTRKIFVFKSIIFNKKKLLPNKHFFLEIRDVEEDILAKEVNQTVNLIDPPKKPKTALRNCFWGLFWKFPHHLSPMSDCFCCNIINFKMISKLS